MQTEIRDLPEQKVIYVRKTGANGNSLTPAAGKAFDVLCKFLTKKNLWGQVGECIGICPDDPVETTAELCCYDGGFVIKPSEEISPSGEVKIQILPAGKYAVFFHRGDYETLWQTWNTIYRDWLPSSGLKLRDAMPYEVYLKDKHKVRPEDLLTEIHIPIE